jgi:hypothetical protein
VYPHAIKPGLRDVYTLFQEGQWWVGDPKRCREEERERERNGPKKKLTSRSSCVKFETPPLEINFLRKASSYAQDELVTSAFFSGDLSVKSVGEKPLFSSPLQNQVRGFLGSHPSPRILSPTRWKFSNTHGMTSRHTLSQSVCHPTRRAEKITVVVKRIITSNYNMSPAGAAPIQKDSVQKY